MLLSYLNAPVASCPRVLGPFRWIQSPLQDPSCRTLTADEPRTGQRGSRTEHSSELPHQLLRGLRYCSLCRGVGAALKGVHPTLTAGQAQEWLRTPRGQRQCSQKQLAGPRVQGWDVSFTAVSPPGSSAELPGPLGAFENISPVPPTLRNRLVLR